MYRRNAAICLSVAFPWMSLQGFHTDMETHRVCRAWAMWLRPLDLCTHGRLAIGVRPNWSGSRETWQGQTGAAGYSSVCPV